MKTLLTIVLCFYAVSTLRAGDDEKYKNAMMKNILMIDTVSGTGSMLDLANSFERIAYAEKDKWLPYYYTSFMYTIACFTDTAKTKSDEYLDKADNFIHVADSLEPDESEIYVMKGMIAQARMQVDPMNRWRKYGPIATNNFQKAIQLDTLNPRPEYLIGVSVYYTPEQFGGGPENAKPLLENSLRKFRHFIPDNDLMPNWGRNSVDLLLKQIKEKTQTTKPE